MSVCMHVFVCVYVGTFVSLCMFVCVWDQVRYREVQKCIYILPRLLFPT